MWARATAAADVRLHGEQRKISAIRTTHALMHAMPGQPSRGRAHHADDDALSTGMPIQNYTVVIQDDYLPTMKMGNGRMLCFRQLRSVSVAPACHTLPRTFGRT